jgi:hypothetical protein
MTVPKPTEKTPTFDAPGAISAMPLKRPRRRSTRGSYSWCFRKPPSRKRVAIAAARKLPETVPAPAPAPERQPVNDTCN